ncbi:MAG: SHOCT domain-containing protein [Georgenia sp.]
MGVWNGMDGWTGMGWGWGWIFVVLLIVGIALLVVALVRGLGGGGTRPPGADRGRARALLDERYARGEIDTTEYQERLRELGGR